MLQHPAVALRQFQLFTYEPIESARVRVIPDLRRNFGPVQRMVDFFPPNRRVIRARPTPWRGAAWPDFPRRFGRGRRGLGRIVRLVLRRCDESFAPTTVYLAPQSSHFAQQLLNASRLLIQTLMEPLYLVLQLLDTIGLP